MTVTKEQLEEIERKAQAWLDLVRLTENNPLKRHIEENSVEIEVAEVLDIGHMYMKPPEGVVVRDTEGKKWCILETQNDREGMQCLVSRYNVKPGMKLRLFIKKESYVTTDTYVIKEKP
jgi:hypothetical protein